MTLRGGTSSRRRESTALTRDSAQLTITGSRTRPIERGIRADAALGGRRIARALRALLATGARRVVEVVTPLGWTVLALVPIGLGVGYTLDWVEAVSIGWASVALVLVALVYLATGAVDTIALAVPHNRVVVGETATGSVRAANLRRRRALGVVVEVPVGDGLARVALPALARGESAEREFPVPTSRRGVVTVGPARTVSADPVGLVRRELQWSGATELFVHPRIVPLAGVSGGLTRDLEGQATRELSASDLAFHAVREYSPGDERRHIHWRSTAKTGRYMVRQFEQTRRSHLVVALSLAPDDYASDEEFELAVSVTASLGVRAIRDTRDVVVIVSAGEVRPIRRNAPVVRALSTVTRSRLLDELALVEQEPEAVPLPTVARIAAASTSGASVAFLVCGSHVTGSAIRAAAARFEPGVLVVALVVDVDAAPEYSRSRAFGLARVGVLDDLRGAVERMLA